MDLNGDGLKDILTASFNGAPQWLENTKDGYKEATSVLGKDGDIVMLSKYWDYETEDWAESERTGTNGLCSSVAAVDWDHDGDMDLLLGDYWDGGLYLCLNEGSATEMKFASTNQVIKVGGEPVAFAGGMGAPRVVDWDGDGLFDIAIGTIRGKVVLLRNAGSQGKPDFPEMTTLVEALPGPSGSKQVKRVLAEDGSPIGPGSSFHIELVDYDADGDLDLLVGGRSEWLTGPEKETTEEDLKRVAELKEQQAEAWTAFKEYKNTAKDDEAAKEIKNTDKYKTLLKKYHSLRKEAYAMTADPVELGDFVWLFRQK